MQLLADIGWRELWVPSGSLIALAVRGTVMYLGLLLLFRILRRNGGSLSLGDVLLVVLISDAAQNGMSGDYRSVTEAVVLVGTIAGWSYLTNWLSFRSPAVARFLEPPPLLLVRDGVMLPRNLRRELITTEELLSQMRQQGIGRIEEVHRCYLEPDGQISMVARSQEAKPDGGHGRTGPL